MTKPTQRGDDPAESVKHNARRWEVDGAEYHATPGVYGKSMIQEYINSPELFHGRQTGAIAPFQPTAAMQFGTNVDRFLLERDTVIEIPTAVLSKSGSKAGGAWNEFKAENEGKLLLKAQEHDILHRIEKNVQEHPEAAVFASGKPQVAIRWTDPITGLEVKCRLDSLGDGWICDLKTTTDLNDFALAKKIESLGYQRQGAMYTWGTELLLERPHKWVFLFVRSIEPYDVVTRTIHKDWMARGMDEIRDGLNRLSESLKTGYWHKPGYGKTFELCAPKYTEYDNEYEVE